MVIERTIQDNYKQEIINHLEATSDRMVKAYTLKQISFLDGIDTRTVKYSWKYMPVRIEDRNSRRAQREGRNRKWYTIKRLRLDEIKHIYNKRNRNKKLVETTKIN